MENFNDVSDAFDGWLQTVTGSRTTGGYVAGRWVAGTATSLSISGVVQNATPDDLKVLEEGQRTEEAIKVHTKEQLIPQDDIAGITGDKISYKSRTWLVYNVADRKIGGYYKAIAIRVA